MDSIPMKDFFNREDSEATLGEMITNEQQQQQQQGNDKEDDNHMNNMKKSFFFQQPQDDDNGYSSSSSTSDDSIHNYTSDISEDNSDINIIGCGDAAVESSSPSSSSSTCKNNNNNNTSSKTIVIKEKEDDQDEDDNTDTDDEMDMRKKQQQSHHGHHHHGHHHHSHHHHHHGSKRVSLATAEDIRVPDIAWPTVGVMALSFGLFILPWYIYVLKDVVSVGESTHDHHENPSPWWIIPSTIALYLAFTVTHDAVHGSISRKYKWINESCGHLSAFMQSMHYFAFKYIHLRHHKYTNDPEKDPDYYSAHFHDYSVLLLPLQWATQADRHLVFYFKRVFVNGKRFPYLWIKAPLHEALHIMFCMLPFWYFSYYYVPIKCGLWRHFFILWYVPNKIAQCFLAFSFDYVPHRYHDITRNENIYKTTHRITGLFGTTNGWDLSLLMCYQNYHVCHHLYPSIPFYRYKIIWEKNMEKLRELGVIECPLIPVDLPWWKAIFGIIDNDYKKKRVPDMFPRPLTTNKLDERTMKMKEVPLDSVESDYLEDHKKMQ